MSLIDLLKEFHSQTVEKEYPVSARLLGYWLIGEFNKAHWPEELTFSERDLYRLTGLPASTIHSAIKYLCDRRHIKTWRKRRNGSTIFKLLSDKTPQSTNGTPPMHQPRTDGAPTEQPAFVPIGRTREDVKTLDVKTKENTQSAGAKSSNLEEFLNSWTSGNGCARSDWLDGKLAELLAKHGLATMTAALERANRKTNGTHGFNLEFFEKQLAKVSQSPKSAQKPKSALKGSESNGETVSKFGYKPVEFDDNEKWW